ncbi:hypothetical protein QNO07_06515 [Streptomyces sp. 549]|uniref:hypothetical protein n=1 Tax=Streptomyces sp. 549 TaxID=3049076 RepID=UPI0024C388C3|nr:hypothetical protein [Streptomyces sp. 549]MDK1473076.1 hypothetical protein [Streptomyces sp. 549]
MKIAGYYKEFWRLPGTGDRETLTSASDNLLAQPEPDVDLIVGYLRSGHAVWDIMGISDDVLGSEAEFVGGYSTLTDGEWVWRQDLMFYVRRYNLALPQELVSKIRGLNYAVPAIPPERTVELGEESAKYM